MSRLSDRRDAGDDAEAGGRAPRQVAQDFLTMAERRLHQGLVPREGRWIWPADRTAELEREARRARIVLIELIGLFGAIGFVGLVCFLLLILIAY